MQFEGHAIVSADGMISAADGSMPPGLRNEADWQQFQAALNRSTLVALGRLGHQRHRNPGRRRLVFTGGVGEAATDPSDPMATLFNPARGELIDLLPRLGIATGMVAVTGGTRVFDFFLPLYDRFVLAETALLAIPDGRPCFSSGHPRTVLAAAGLKPAGFEVIDEAARVTLTRWER